MQRHKTGFVLSWIVAALATVVSVGGLFWGGLYRDNAMIKAAMQGNDLVTLVLVVPLMIVAMVFVRRGSQRAELVWLGTVVYMLYNFAFYLFGCAFNRFFWLYVALFSLSIWALVFSVPRLDVAAMVRGMRAKTPVRWVAGWMFALGAQLGVMWLVRSASFWTTGVVPVDVTQTGNPTAIVYALDGSILIPAFIIAAVMLWNRKPWGYAMSVIVMVKGVAYAIGLQAMSYFANVQTGTPDPLTPFYAYLGLFSALALGAMLVGMRPAAASGVVTEGV